MMGGSLQVHNIQVSVRDGGARPCCVSQTQQRIFTLKPNQPNLTGKDCKGCQIGL